MNIFDIQKQWKEKFYFTDTFYLPFGCNTYEIKDKLKGAGCHFWRGLGWYCTDDDDVYKSVLATLPEGAELVPFNFSDCGREYLIVSCSLCHRTKIICVHI